MPGLTKGIGFHNLSLFTQKRFGEVGWEKLLASMSAEDQQLLRGMIPMGWYELELYARAVKQLAGVHGDGQPGLLEEFGRFSAEQDLSTIHKLLMKVVDPGMIFDQGMKLWRRMQDTGEWHISRESNRAVGHLTGWGHVDAVLCRELVGYFEVLLGSGRGKQVRVGHSECRAHGAPGCVFVATWR